VKTTEREEYGLRQWIEDGIASGYVFLQVQWKALVYGGALAPVTIPEKFKVRVIYRVYPNQAAVERMKFENVSREDLHAARMRIVEADRQWKEHNARIAEILAKTLGGV
jgi:hypothetical protein